MASNHYPSLSQPAVWSQDRDGISSQPPRRYNSPRAVSYEQRYSAYHPPTSSSESISIRSTWRKPLTLQPLGQRAVEAGNITPEPGSAPSNYTSFRPRSQPPPVHPFSTHSYYEPAQPLYPQGHQYSQSTQSLHQPSQRPNLNVWEDSQSPLRRTQSVFASPDRPTRDIDAFDDVSQFHLFVEATSGLPSFNPFSPTSPPGVSSSHTSGYYNSSIPPEPFEIYPRRSSRSFPLTQPATSLPARQEATRSQAYSDGRNPWNLMDEELDEDEELPNYEQSQAEVNLARRTEATRRARELERRWRERERGRR